MIDLAYFVPILMVIQLYTRYFKPIWEQGEPIPKQIRIAGRQTFETRCIRSFELD